MNRFTFRRSLAAVATCAAILTLGATGTAFAAGVQDNGLFELGNNTATPAQGSADILCSETQAGPDWNCLFSATGVAVSPLPTGGQAAVFLGDDVSAGSLTDRTVYSGGPGDKNSDTIDHWTWGTSSVPVKDDIGNAYAYAVKDSNDHLIIYVGGERLSNSGDAHIDVEFFQKPVGLDLSRGFPCPDGKCKFNGENTPGDLLVNMDFTNGGAFAGLTVRERDPNSPNNYKVLATLNAQGCNTAATVCAFTNGGSIDGGAWPNYDSHGAVVTQIPSNGFTEWGVDVTALLQQANLCFSTVQVKTRSSQSFTATLKDFAIHSFESCTATTTTQIKDANGTVLANDQGLTTTVAAGTVVHDVATVTGTPGAPNPTGSVTFSRFDNATCSAPAASTENAPLNQQSPPTASSSDFTTVAGSSLSYTAHYNGDGTYPPSAESGCEPLTVATAASATTTTIRSGSISGTEVLNDNVALGTVLYDVATVSGTAGFDPTGTVTVTRYTSANCATGTEAAGYPKTINLVDDGQNDGSAGTGINSDSYTPSGAAGEFVGWTVSYDGDTHYSPSTASHCEPVCAYNPISQ